MVEINKTAPSKKETPESLAVHAALKAHNENGSPENWVAYKKAVHIYVKSLPKR